MRRLSIPILAVLVVSLALGLVLGGVTPSTATTVNGVTTSTSTVNAELATVMASPRYLCYLNDAEILRTQGQSGLTTPYGATRASYSSGFVANWLNTEITNQIVHQAVQSAGYLPLSQSQLVGAQSDLLGSIDSTLTQARGTQYDCGATATQILGAMPASFVRAQIVAQAETEALLEAQGGLKLDTASVQSYYDAHVSDFDTYCLSGISLSDTTKYAAIKAAFDSGTSFASLASTYSQDSTTATKGGVLGCFDPTSASYATVLADAKSLPVGTLSSLIQSSSSSSSSSTGLVLLVTSRTSTPLSSIESYVRRTMLAKDAASSSNAARRLLIAASVTVNPRYGTWKTTGTLLGVVPPPVPPVTSLLNARAIQPGAAA